jgi:hypothetical protein
VARARVAAGRAPSLGLVPSGGTSGAGIQGSTARPAGWPRAAPRVGIRARPRAGGARGSPRRPGHGGEDISPVPARAWPRWRWRTLLAAGDSQREADTASGPPDASRGRCPVNQQHVFHHTPFLLAAIARFLCSHILGAYNGSLGAVMTKRGAALGVAAGASSDADASSGRGQPPRGAGGRATRAGRHESIDWPLTGACRTSTHAVFESSSASGRRVETTAGLPVSAVGMLIGRISSRLPARSMQGPFGHVAQERRRKRGN